jgi:hypothetical protein
MNANEHVVVIPLIVRATGPLVDERAWLRVGVSPCPKIQGSQSA